MASGSMIQRQIIDASYTTIKPTSSVKNSDAIEFIIYSKNHFFDLQATELEVKFRIKKSDGNNLDAASKVSIVNYPIGSLFQNVQVLLNNQQISHGGANYALRSYFETLLSYSVGTSKGWLQAGLFHKDTAGQMDNPDPAPADVAGSAAPVNAGLKERASYTNESALTVARGKLHLDMFNQGKPLSNNLEMKIKLFRNNDAFCLMSSDAALSYKIEIEDMTLIVRQLTVSPEILKSVSRGVRYPLTRVIMKDNQIPAGGKSLNINQFHHGILPTKIILALVKSDALVGTYTENPFNFKHYNLSELSLRINGHVLDGTALKFDYDANDYVDGYWSLFRATGKKYRDESLPIKQKDFKSGYAIYAFDLTPSQCDDQYKDPQRDGRIELDFTFAKNIPESVNLCAYLQFDSEILVNEAGVVTPLFQV